MQKALAFERKQNTWFLKRGRRKEERTGKGSRQVREVEETPHTHIP